MAAETAPWICVKPCMAAGEVTLSLRKSVHGSAASPDLSRKFVHGSAASTDLSRRFVRGSAARTILSRKFVHGSAASTVLSKNQGRGVFHQRGRRGQCARSAATADPAADASGQAACQRNERGNHRSMRKPAGGAVIGQEAVQHGAGHHRRFHRATTKRAPSRFKGRSFRYSRALGSWIDKDAPFMYRCVQL